MSGMRIPRAVLALAVGTALLTGCFTDGKSAAPALPSSTCFGVFTPAELAPFMGSGEEVEVYSPDELSVNVSRGHATCNISVDGKSRFTASIDRRRAGLEVTWGSEVEKHRPDVLPYAEHSRLWDSGVVLIVNCKADDGDFDLRLFIDAVPDEVKPEERRPVFAALMKKFLAASREQANCPG
ncbi:hypothetical protein ACIA6E_29545 [Streptomyces sp. NPDC051815]|uniref:hypothetical protein n=1 Tax=Streptomyces sp. NPDC051815 TaxID=3365674 RepID=UPI0037A0E277